MAPHAARRWRVPGSPTDGSNDYGTANPGQEEDGGRPVGRGPPLDSSYSCWGEARVSGATEGALDASQSRPSESHPAAPALTSSLFRKSPELLEERMSAAKQAKRWDRFPGAAPGGDPAAPLRHPGRAGSAVWLDQRARGGRVDARWRGPSMLLESRRIQRERGHSVACRGPYRYLRHPRYSGSILYNLAAPSLLGSLAALWAGAAIVVLIVMRTALEDRMVQHDTPVGVPSNPGPSHVAGHGGWPQPRFCG